MTEVDVVDAAEAGPGDRLHALLLTMTGRVDDDAINSARELLGMGQPGAAIEFLSGCLIAGDIPVDPAEQFELRRVLEETRSPRALADRLHVVESVSADEHRFTERTEADDDLIAALAPITARLGGVRGVWSTERSTPAGTSYGAVPRRVLLAEVGSDGSVAAVGYQLLEALRRAGVHCSVDVFGSGAELPEYHRQALTAARRVHLDEVASTAARRQEEAPAAPEPPEPERVRAEPARPEPARPEPAGPEPARQEPARAEPASPEPAPEPVPEPEPEPAAPRAEAPAEPQRAGKGDQGNMRVPAAVDAKLTDRERNLLRKLHEELAQREQDRPRGQSAPDAGAVATGVQQPARGQDAWTTTMPGGTGGFPPIGAPVNQPGYSGQQRS
ncbi:hypothetical protein [Saccharopolyspora sp. CA-218241]|uniref:hypothetical protein n=1 Tax=Saccharopolyspora sp. CA-218241 TaxID=3240027 RepID=UPI003D961E19